MRRLFALLGVAAVAVGMATSATAGGTKQTTSGTGEFYLDTSACPGFITEQPGFHPFGSTITVNGSFRFRTWFFDDSPTRDVDAKVSGSFTDVNTGAEYSYDFAGSDTGVITDLLGTGRLTIKPKGGGKLVADSVTLIQTGEFFMSAQTVVQCPTSVLKVAASLPMTRASETGVCTSHRTRGCVGRVLRGLVGARP
jgi:hypothetical protein